MSDKKRIFDFKNLSMFLIAPFLIDLLDGLVLEESFIMIKKESKTVGYKKGLGGEVLISEILDDVSMLELKYLPNAEIIPKLNALRVVKTQFGLQVKNRIAPKYLGAARECRFLEKPETKIGTIGFDDLRIMILMTDYIDAYL